MLTITAVIRAKAGEEATIAAALLAVAEHVRAHEPGTLGFHVSRDSKDGCVFTTYERFLDQAAMDTHNNGPGAKGFFAVAEGRLDGTATLVFGTEIAASP